MLLQILGSALVGAAVGGVAGHFGKCTSGACPLTANPLRGAAVGLLIGAMMGASSCAPTGTGINSTKANSAVVHVAGDQDFADKVLGSSQLALVDFYADWCGPCRKLAPVVEALADEHRESLMVAKVNVDDHPELARKYKVRSIPHLVLIKDGKPVDKRVGYTSKGTLADWVEQHQ